MRLVKINIILAAIMAFCSVAFGAANQSADAQITKNVLENGVTVVVKPEKGSGLIAIDVMIRAGAAQESIQNAGIGNFVAQLVLASTRLSSAEEVAAVADEVGGSIGAQWQRDYTEIRAITTTSMFNKSMTLIGECLTQASFEDKWVEQVREKLLRSLRTDSDDIFENAYTDLRSLLYEDNGYRRQNLGIERTIKLATAQDLKKFYATYYVPNNIVVSIAGDVTVEQAIDRVEKIFAGIPEAKLPIDRGVPDETLERSKFLASEVDITTAYLMIGWLAPGVKSVDYPAVSVAANALGGGKGSIMFRELRQKKGIGYDVGTIYPRFKYQSHVVAYVITNPFKTEEFSANPNGLLEQVKTSLLEQVNQLKQKPLSDQELQRAKGYTIGTYALSHQHLQDRAYELGWTEITGAGYEMYKRFPDDVEKVTAEDVQRVASKYFNNYAAVVLLPKVQSPPVTSENNTSK